MKWNSIKSQFLIFLAVCLAGMILLVGSQYHYTKRLIELNQQSNLLLRLSNDLLQMRRHEKDFLLRYEMQYIDKFTDKSNNFAVDLRSLEPIFANYEINADDLRAIEESAVKYRQLFLKLVELQVKIGLDEKSGEQGDFRQAVHELERVFAKNQRVSDNLLLLQMRRNEKDFMLRKELEYVDSQKQFYQRLAMSISNGEGTSQGDLIKLLNDYQQGFLTLVDSYSQMGLTHELGLQGEFRQQSHAIEAQLGKIRDDLQPLINAEENRVLNTGLLILVATSLALMFIIVRSFNSFQRAFATFVMFFHRAKRELAPVDVRKVVYSEFQGLATVANEMVEARRDMELQLKRTMDKLEQLTSRLDLSEDKGVADNQSEESTSRTHATVVYTMGAIGESRSRHMGNHVKRVAEFTKLLALKVGLDEQQADILKQASSMHDIGTVAIPDEILNKQGPLTDKEMEIMKEHALLGYEMLCHSERPLLKAAAIVAHEHHEKWDGNGYPRGLAGEEIHIYGRITMLADVFDALGSKRCYKEPWKDDEIFAFIQEQSGRMFDPNLVEIMFDNMEEFLKVRQRYADSV